MTALILILGIAVGIVSAAAGVILIGYGMGCLIDGGTNLRDAGIVLAGVMLLGGTILTGCVAVNSLVESERSDHCSPGTVYVSNGDDWRCAPDSDAR